MKPDESWMVATPLKINNDSSKATSAPRSVTAKGLVPETDAESSEVKAHTTIWLAGQGARTASPAGLNFVPPEEQVSPGASLAWLAFAAASHPAAGALSFRHPRALKARPPKLRSWWTFQHATLKPPKHC